MFLKAFLGWAVTVLAEFVVGPILLIGGGLFLVVTSAIGSIILGLEDGDKTGLFGDFNIVNIIAQIVIFPVATILTVPLVQELIQKDDSASKDITNASGTVSKALGFLGIPLHEAEVIIEKTMNSATGNTTATDYTQGNKDEEKREEIPHHPGYF